MAFVDVLLGFGGAKWCHSPVKFNGESRGWHPFLPIPNRWEDISRSSTNLGLNGLIALGRTALTQFLATCLRSTRQTPIGAHVQAPLQHNLGSMGPLGFASKNFNFQGPTMGKCGSEPDLTFTAPHGHHGAWQLCKAAF